MTAIPFPGWQTSANGTTLASGAKIYFYVPTTETLRTPFSDSALTVPTTNPVILNSSGWPTTNIYLDNSLAYEYVVKSADDATTYVPATLIPAGAELDDATLVALAGLTLAEGDYIEATGADTVRARKTERQTYAALTAIGASARFDDMLVYVASRATDGDGGEGFWRFDASSSATANGGTILAPDSGTGRWLRQGTSYIDPLWFGVKGDDSTDNATTMAAAFSAADGRKIIFPAGNFRTSVRHSFSGEDVSIEGAGQNITNIVWTGTTQATTGLSVTLTNDEHFLRIEGVTFKTTTATTGTTAATYFAGKIALFVDASAQISAGVIQNRSNKRLFIDDFSMVGADDSLTSGWDVGICLRSVGWYTIQNWVFLGQFDAPDWKGIAVLSYGLGTPVEVNFNSFRIYSAHFAFLFVDYIEGVYISEFDIVNVRVGVFGLNVSGISEDATFGLLQPTICFGHINCRLGAMSIANCNQATLSDLNLYLQPIETDGQTTAVNLTTGDLNCLSNIRISYLDGSVHTGGDEHGVVLTTISTSTLTNVVVSAAADFAVILTGTSTKNILTGVSAINCGAGISYDTSASANVEVGSSFPGTTTRRSVTNTNNVIEYKIYTTPHTATLTGGATSETLDVAIPAAWLEAKPRAAFLTASGVSQIIGAYDYDSASSTATNARFLLYKADGGTIGAGAYRFSVSIHE